MEYRSCFDIIGPIMIGPSSSHTAGALLIGKFAYSLLDKVPEQAEIVFYDSFAQTYRGHGTDKALIGGLLNLDTDDHRIKEALALAQSLQLEVKFKLEESCPYYEHPNTVLISAENQGHKVKVGGASLGGGLVKIFLINHLKVDLRISSEDDLVSLSKRFKLEKSLFPSVMEENLS